MINQGYAYNAPRDSSTTRIVAITAVDPVSRTASGMTREHSVIMINCSYPVGGLLVTPAVGEQWYVQRQGVEYILLTRLPANSPELLVEAAEGQVQVGSTGPLTLHGSEVQVGSKLKLGDTLYRDTAGALQSSTDGGLTWTTLASADGSSGVLSVAGKSGAVTLLPSDIETLTGILAAKADLVNGVISPSQLPSLGVQRYADQSSLPLPGDVGTLYIAEDTWDVYLWDSVNYLLVGGPSFANSIPGPDDITGLLESWTGINFSEGPLAFVTSIFTAVIRTFENLTTLDFSNGPLEFAKSLVAGIQGLLDVQNWVDLFEEWTNLNLHDGLIAFIKSLFQTFSIPFVENLEALTGIDLFEVFSNTTAMIQVFMEKIWGTLDQGIIAQFVDWFENLTGLIVSQGPGTFLTSLANAVFFALRDFISAVETLFGNLTSATFNLPIILTTFIGNLMSAPGAVLGQFLETLENTGWGLINGLAQMLFNAIGLIPFVGPGVAATLQTAWTGFVTFFRGSTKAANNLIKDSGFENPRSWNSQPDIVYNHEFAFRKSGLVSILFTSGGTADKSFYWNVDDRGAITPLVTQAAEVFYAECYVLYPTTVGNTGTSATMTLVAEFSSTSGTLPTVVSSVNTTITRNNLWQKVNGGFITPGGSGTAQYDRVSFGLRLGQSAAALNDKFFVDEIVVKETTQAQNTLDGIHQAIYGGTGTLKTVGEVQEAIGGVTDLTRGYASSANLLADPKVNSVRFWKNFTGLGVSTEYYRSTTQSLRLTSNGNGADRYFYFNVNDTGPAPLTTKSGDVFYVECYVFSPTTNAANAIIRMKGWAYNSSTDSLAGIIADNGSLTVGTNPIRGTLSPQYPGGNPWTKLYGYFTIPEGYDGFLAGIVLASGESTENNRFFIDDMVVQDVTAVVRTNNALYGSQTPSTTITTSALPDNIPQGKISNLDGTITTLNQGISGASGAAASASAAASGAFVAASGASAAASGALGRANEAFTAASGAAGTANQAFIAASGAAGTALAAQQSTDFLYSSLISGYTVQGFSQNGTWNKPSDAGITEMWVVLFGAGGNGSSGVGGNTIQNGVGGAGGAAGAVIATQIDPAFVPSSVAVTIGTAASPITYFGGVLNTSQAYSNSVATPLGLMVSASLPTAGGAGGWQNNNQSGAAGATTAAGRPGGAGGARSFSAGTPSGNGGLGSNGIVVNQLCQTGGAGGGGGGQGSGFNIPPGNGGNGGAPGGGGGGGGGNANGSTVGSGGIGGNGAAVIVYKKAKTTA